MLSKRFELQDDQIDTNRNTGFSQHKREINVSDILLEVQSAQT